MNILLRPARAEDRDFLYELYRSTRSHDLGAADLHPSQLDTLLEFQFNAKERAYEAEFPAADHEIVLLEDVPVGRIIVERTEGEITGVDLALLPPHRNAGMGTRLIENLLKEAEAAGKPFRISVERSNRAARLYARLGMRSVGGTAIHDFLEWLPPRRR